MESLHQLLDDINAYIRYNIILIICQALLYGIYLVLFPIAVHAMVANGLQSRARKWTLATITFTFAVINAYWIFSVVSTFLTIGSLNNVLMACYGSQNAFACAARGLVADLDQRGRLRLITLGDIPLINFIITDGVIVWRAWVLCSDQSKVVLMIPVVTLAINAVIYLIMVVVTVILVISKDFLFISHLNHIVDITQVTLLTLSLVINIYATSIMALKVWKNRKFLIESGMGIRTPGQAMKILALLVESGVIYILISAMSLASIAIFIQGAVSTLIYLVGVHLAGIYPIVVVLLVEKNRSLNTTYCSFGIIIDIQGNRPSQAEGWTFAHGPVLASDSEIAPEMKPPNHDTDN